MFRCLLLLSTLLVLTIGAFGCKSMDGGVEPMPPLHGEVVLEEVAGHAGQYVAAFRLFRIIDSREPVIEETISRPRLTARFGEAASVTMGQTIECTAIKKSAQTFALSGTLISKSGRYPFAITAPFGIRTALFRK